MKIQHSIREIHRHGKRHVVGKALWLAIAAMAIVPFTASAQDWNTDYPTQLSPRELAAASASTGPGTVNDDYRRQDWNTDYPSQLSPRELAAAKSRPRDHQP